ncbi:Uncharacterized protein UPF0065 [Alkaliphilus metalliredigens QYMF]|uniref:Uncharacterized protein UPF0065 n=1 Tax=Alkaliphilus metalliredigens (strain QYMF) TaxID=293826 RepID=A6TSQ7_ALKMQ|nr:tripartite tricarboxylate transporter substrate binding protein [Alkaliphilus metalliredigens]ABR49225.1 Uncharacterized protein UPF0065 [Alkaliphilus metalliredigens QYMF]
MNKKVIIGTGVLVTLALLFGGYENISKHRKDQFISKYPDQSIQMLVAYKEGGGTDVGARILAAAAESYLGQPIVVKNIQGGDGELGFKQLTMANANGYTVGFINLPTFLSLSMERDTVYSKESIIPIMNYVYDPAVIVVSKHSQWKTIEELIQYSKANPLDMTISNNGRGASNHIAAAQLAYEANIDVTHVPFGGTADMLRALRYGHVKATVAKVSEVASHIESGELRMLATFTENRLEGFFDVPTLQEKGYPISFGSARALAVPKGTPEEIVDILHMAFKKAMENEEHITQAKEANLPIKYMSPLELQRYIEQSEESLSNIIPKIGL